MKSIARTRSMRGAESPQRDRDPFGFGVRQKASPILEVAKRRARNNGENIAPENATNILDVPSPAPCKGTTKGSKTPIAVKDLAMPSSGAFMPKLPKPSPARNVQPPSQGQECLTQVPPTGPGPDHQTGTKRKLNLEVHTGGVVEGLMSAATVEPSDTGVKVIVRTRPLNKKEATEEATHIVQKLSHDSVSIGDQQFTYDAVAGENESQQAVFEMVGLPMVENCLAGFNSSIFAYGQTGSGKTHTMWGPMPGSSSDLVQTEERGITPRVFEQLFARIQQEERNNVEKQLRYQCRCSFLEIYNEQITDLLEPSQKNLMIREDTKTGVYVDSLTEEYVSNMDDVTRLLVRGLANRRVGSTSMNNESSRSHSVFTFVIESRSKSVAEGVSSVRSSRMNLVDLAGSERQKQTGAAGDRLKEAGNINKSLSQLGNVINILAEVAQTGKHRHIPYRDSRLTFLLQESLGGNAKLAMICAISPASSCRSETLSTLRFAQRAKAMQNKAVVNEETANDVNLLREQIRQLKDELMRMKANGNQQEGGGGFANGWNARRSYNLLRLSLGQPMTIPETEVKDIDEDIKVINENEGAAENNSEQIVASTDTETKELLPLTIMESEEATNSDLKENVAHGGDAAPKTESEAPSATEIPELSLSLLVPTLSVSPRVKEKLLSDNSSELAKSPLGNTIRNSRAFSSSTEQLAATLTRGVEILDKRSSISVLRRSAGVRFSFQTGDGQQALKKDALLRRLTSSSNTPLPNEGRKALCPLEIDLEITPTKPQSPAAGDLSPWPQITLEDSSKIVPATPPAQKQNFQALEVLMAGAIRREKSAEETIAQQAADLEQLNRLVCQYKLERECNAVIQQSREEKMARMECLMDGVLPLEDFRNEEWSALQLEHKMLQEKFDHHPDVAEARAEQDLLRHELQQYRSFCDLGERDALQEEVMQLRNQLQFYLETGTPGSLKQRRLSLTPKKSIPPHSPVKLLSLTAVSEGMSSCESTSSSNNVKGASAVAMPEAPVDGRLDEERREWDEREKEWISVVQELREESDRHLQLADKRRKELEGEKRCSQEMHEALQMAMTGHARLLDQYVELQERHILLLAKMREIRDGVIDMKKVAKKSGLNTVESRWFDVQATQIVFMKLEQDRHKEEIKGLQAQLQDTADAVQAAGELLVRLKEAEQSATIAKQTATAAEQDSSGLRRDSEKLKRRHAKEIASLQQRLLESCSAKPSPCPMCGTADPVKTDSSGVDQADSAKKEEEGKECDVLSSDPKRIPDSWSSDTSLSECTDRQSLSDSWNSEVAISMNVDKKSVLDSWSSGKGLSDEVEDEVEVEEDDDEAETESMKFSRTGYQYLENLEIEEFNDEGADDDFLCEACGQPATNGMRVCDSCI